MKYKTRTRIAAALFILPSFLGILIFYIIPYVICFINSMYSGGEFTGAANYAELLKNDAFWLAMKNTAVFMGVGITLLLVISFLLALFLNSFKKISAFFRSALLIPVIVPSASLICVWQLFFEDKGVINGILNSFGLDSVKFFGGGFSMVMIIFIYIWKNCGFCVILFTAGLANIPEQYYESARLDGASKLKTVTKISMPLITPTAFFAFLMAVIYSFKIFREVFVLFGDYPDENVYFLQNFINNNFKSLNFAHLSSASIVFSVFLILLLLLFFIFERKRNFLE